MPTGRREWHASGPSAAQLAQLRELTYRRRQLAASEVPPILLSVAPVGDGRLAVTWSTRPGRRVVIVTSADAWSDDVAALMISAVLPTTEVRQSP